MVDDERALCLIQGRTMNGGFAGQSKSPLVAGLVVIWIRGSALDHTGLPIIPNQWCRFPSHDQGV